MAMEPCTYEPPVVEVSEFKLVKVLNTDDCMPTIRRGPSFIPIFFQSALVDWDGVELVAFFATYKFCAVPSSIYTEAPAG